jgi:arginyl-tRNA synthetase
MRPAISPPSCIANEPINSQKNLCGRTPQTMHFRQVFAVLEKAGFAKARDCIHVGFGLVKFADRKLSTRSGDVILRKTCWKKALKRPWRSSGRMPPCAIRT